MAHVIEFYVPTNFLKKVRPIRYAQPGRVIAFYRQRRNRRNATRASVPGDAGQPSEAMEPLVVNGPFPGWKLIRLLQHCFR